MGLAVYLLRTYPYQVRRKKLNLLMFELEFSEDILPKNYNFKKKRDIDVQNARLQSLLPLLRQLVLQTDILHHQLQKSLVR